MRTVAFALMTMFLLDGCLVRVVEPKGHTYYRYDPYGKDHQERKEYGQKPVRKKIVYKDVINTKSVNNTYMLKYNINDKHAYKRHKPEESGKKRKRKARKQEKIRKVKQHATVVHHLQETKRMKDRPKRKDEKPARPRKKQSDATDQALL